MIIVRKTHSLPVKFHYQTQTLSKRDNEIPHNNQDHNIDKQTTTTNHKPTKNSTPYTTNQSENHTANHNIPIQ